MSSAPRLFVSFSSRDKPAVRDLFACLKIQEIDVWDYSEEGQELPLGKNIKKSLEEKLFACEYFIAVISPNSLDRHTGKYTHFEVQSAVNHGLLERGRILPIVLEAGQSRRWSGAYKNLQDVKWVQFRNDEEMGFGEFDLLEICNWLGLAYNPPAINDPRVFFMSRLRKEIANHDWPISRYYILLKAVYSCAKVVVNERWAEARESITAVALSNHLLGGEKLYIPQIAKGVCEAMSGDLAQAERTFMEACSHPSRDENAFAGLGYTLFCQGRYDEAMASFFKAREIAPDCDDIAFNIIVTMLASAMLTGHERIHEDMFVDGLSPEDWFKVTKMKGILCAEKRDYLGAIRYFEELQERATLDDASVIYYARALTMAGRELESNSLLLNEAQRTNDPNLYHHLADAYLKSGWVEDALAIYKEKLCPSENSPKKYLIEYARILHAIPGSNHAALIRWACDAVLHQDASNLSEDDYYYLGFASYILGKHESAELDYGRSNRRYPYYSQLKL